MRVKYNKTYFKKEQDDSVRDFAESVLDSGHGIEDKIELMQRAISYLFAKLIETGDTNAFRFLVDLDRDDERHCVRLEGDDVSSVD